MDIICACGHPITDHRSRGCIHINHDNCYCMCPLTEGLVEARWWARYYKAQYDALYRHMKQAKYRLSVVELDDDDRPLVKFIW